eukprot:9278045-Lingulodinium_polyedra.AAC.1
MPLHIGRRCRCTRQAGGGPLLRRARPAATRACPPKPTMDPGEGREQDLRAVSQEPKHDNNAYAHPT